MYYYRLTKYNPKERNEKGWYLKDEWTDVSCVGKTFEGKELTAEDYLAVENKFIETYLEIMKLNHVKQMELISFQGPYGGSYVHDTFDQNIKKTFELLKNDHWYSTERTSAKELTIEEMLKLLLRSYIGGQLVHPNLFFHFGYDYYSYVVSRESLLDFKNNKLDNELFLEQKVSPSLDWIKERDYEYIKLYGTKIQNEKEVTDLILEKIKTIEKNHLIIYTSGSNITEKESLKILEQLPKKLSKKDSKYLNKIIFDET